MRSISEIRRLQKSFEILYNIEQGMYASTALGVLAWVLEDEAADLNISKESAFLIQGAMDCFSAEVKVSD